MISSNITFTLVALYKYNLEEIDNAEDLRKSPSLFSCKNIDLLPAWQSYFVKIGCKDVNSTKTNKELQNEKVLVSHINTKECHEPPIFFSANFGWQRRKSWQVNQYDNLHYTHVCWIIGWINRKAVIYWYGQTPNKWKKWGERGGGAGSRGCKGGPIVSSNNINLLDLEF